MEEENQVMKEPQQVQQEPQRVTTKDPKKVEVGKRLAAISRKKREEAQNGSESILRHQSCYSCGSDRWSWLLHLLNQERRAGRATFKPATK